MTTLVGVASLAGSAGAAPAIEEGRAFPPLLLPAVDDGRPLSIADFRGRKVALHVFASW